MTLNATSGSPPAAVLAAQLAIMILSMLTVSSALGAEPDVWVQSLYFSRSQRHLEAAALAAEAIEADPADPAAHIAYQTAWHWLGEQPVIVRQYRTWYEAEPEDETARVSLARALLWEDRVGNREEMEQLLGGRFNDERAQFWALRTLWLSRSTANPPGDVDVIVERMAPLARGHEDRSALVSVLRAQREPVEGELARSLERAAKVCPWMLSDISAALWSLDAEGAALDRVRERVLRRATAAIESAAPYEVMAASVTFHHAGEETLEERADRRLIELDPVWEELWNPTGRRLAAAMDREDPEATLERIDAIEEGVSSPRDFAAVWSARAEVLRSMGRNEVALHAWMRAHEYRPEEPQIILQYVALAGMLGRGGLEGVELLDHAIELAHAQDFGTASRRRDGGYDRWRERHNSHLATLYHLQASLLRDTGQIERAAAACRLSLALNDDALTHTLLGRLYEQLGEPDLAYDHRAMGYEPEHTWATASMHEAWDARPYWHPAGAQGYFEDRAAAMDAADDDDTTSGDGSTGPGADHPLIGHTFPDLVFDVDGDEARLSQLEGPHLVELWATW